MKLSQTNNKMLDTNGIEIKIDSLVFISKPHDMHSNSKNGVGMIMSAGIVLGRTPDRKKVIVKCDDGGKLKVADTSQITVADVDF